MRVPRFLPGAKHSRAFTLMELLVVITIIGILAAIILSIFAKVQGSSRKIQVISEMRNLKVAVISYYTDYRKYPLNDVQISAVEYGGNDTVYGDPGGLYSSADVFNILRAQSDARFNQNNQLNPNQTVYWPGDYVKNPTKPVNGITTVDFKDGANTIKKGSLVDPWGHEYLMWFDANGDGDLSTAAGWFYHDVKAGKVHPGDPPMGFEFGSLGPDGQFGTSGNNVLGGSDDIVTWQ